MARRQSADRIIDLDKIGTRQCPLQGVSIKVEAVKAVPAFGHARIGRLL